MSDEGTDVDLVEADEVESVAAEMDVNDARFKTMNRAIYVVRMLTMRADDETGQRVAFGSPEEGAINKLLRSACTYLAREFDA